MKFLTLTIIAIALLTNPAISQETKTTDHMQEMETEGMEGMTCMQSLTTEQPKIPLAAPGMLTAIKILYHKFIVALCVTCNST